MSDGLGITRFLSAQGHAFCGHDDSASSLKGIFLRDARLVQEKKGFL